MPLEWDAAGKKESGALKCNEPNKDEEIFKDSAKCWGSLFGNVPQGSGVYPKKGEFKPQQVQHRGVGKGREEPILGKELKNIICVWPRMLGEDMMPAYKYRGNVNTRQGSKLI